MSSIKDSLEAFQDASKYTQTSDVDAFERRGYIVHEIGFTCGQLYDNVIDFYFG